MPARSLTRQHSLHSAQMLSAVIPPLDPEPPPIPSEPGAPPQPSPVPSPVSDPPMPVDRWTEQAPARARSTNVGRVCVEGRSSSD